MDKLKNFSFKKKSKNSQPYIIVSEFENITEKECIKFDKSNQENYNNLLSKAKQAQYTIRNSGLSMNLEVPLPPRPSNRDRFNLWKRRNVSKPVIEQSNAVIFLNEHGYKLDTHYEAYQAIELAKEIRRKKGIDTYKDTSKNFNNIYTQKDANIFRRRSMYGLENVSRNNQEHSTNYGFNQHQSHNNGCNDFSEPSNLEQMSEISNNSQLSLKRRSGSINGRSGSINGRSGSLNGKRGSLNGRCGSLDVSLDNRDREFNNILDIDTMDYISKDPSAPPAPNTVSNEYITPTNSCNDVYFETSNIDNKNFNNSLYPSI